MTHRDQVVERTKERYLIFNFVLIHSNIPDSRHKVTIEGIPVSSAETTLDLCV